MKCTASQVRCQGFCLFDLILYILVNNFSVMLGQVFLGCTSTKLRIKCHAQGHNAVSPVRLELETPQSQVKHSTSEPPDYLEAKERSSFMAGYGI